MVTDSAATGLELFVAPLCRPKFASIPSIECADQFAYAVRHSIAVN